MLAAPVVNPIVIASTWIAFGHMPGLVVGRIVLVFAVAVIVAVVFGRHGQPSELLVDAPAAPACAGHDHAHDHGHDHGRGRLRALLDHANDEFFGMVKFLVLGALLAAAKPTAPVANERKNAPRAIAQRGVREYSVVLLNHRIIARGSPVGGRRPRHAS